jgi:hypothetical protein
MEELDDKEEVEKNVKERMEDKQEDKEKCIDIRKI